jgi:tetratricopeptide (TPR) repeat protein
LDSGGERFRELLSGYDFWAGLLDWSFGFSHFQYLRLEAATGHKSFVLKLAELEEVEFNEKIETANGARTDSHPHAASHSTRAAICKRCIPPRGGCANAVTCFDRAMAKLKKGDRSGAMADFDLAIKLNPNLSGAYRDRGALKQMNVDFSGAMAYYNQAIKLNPKNARAYNKTGTNRRNRAI